MSLSSWVLRIVLLSFGTPAFAGNEITCPNQLADGGRTALLDSADVYEGAPENLASLMPDLDKWEWRLEVEQDNARRSGVPLYLVCRYKGTKATVQLKIPYAATICRVKGVKNGTYAGCRPARRR